MDLNIANPAALDVMLSRRSLKTRYMGEPAPAGDNLQTMLKAATRVPDHGKLTPWRYIVLEKTDQEKLGAIIQDALITEGESSEKTALKMAGFATQAPLLIVAVYSPIEDSKIPLLEQQMSCGASVMNLIMAAHALNYAGVWLTGWASRSRTVAEGMGLAPHEEVAGFVFFGSKIEETKERRRPALEDVVSYGLGEA